MEKDLLPSVWTGGDPFLYNSPARGVNESSLSEPRLSKLGSFIFCPGSSSARQGLNQAQA
jgi:hypothetical protein